VYLSRENVEVGEGEEKEEEEEEEEEEEKQNRPREENCTAYIVILSLRLEVAVPSMPHYGLCKYATCAILSLIYASALVL